jgi:general stress protein CsbA
MKEYRMNNFLSGKKKTAMLNGNKDCSSTFDRAVGERCIVEMKYILALLLPGMIVVFFTRVVYNHYLGLLLTVALIAASVYRGYTDTMPLIIIDAFSLTVGFYFANKLVHRNTQKK